MQQQLISIHKQSDNYQLFILRIWQETPDGPFLYMLKATDSEQRYVFSDASSG